MELEQMRDTVIYSKRRRRDLSSFFLFFFYRDEPSARIRPT